MTRASNFPCIFYSTLTVKCIAVKESTFFLQINEEDESKASSRNSIHRQHGGAREADEDRGREEDRASSLPTPTTSGTTVVQGSARETLN